MFKRAKIVSGLGRPWQRTWSLGVLLTAVVLALGWWSCSRSAPAAPPSVDLQGVDPAIRAAVEDALEQVRRTPGAAEAWGNLGLVLSDHVFDSEAFVCFAQAERLDPADPRWPNYQATILRRPDPAASLPKLQRAADLTGNEPNGPRLRLAELYLELGRRPQARQEFEKLLEHEPRHPRAELGLARLHFLAGELEECRARLSAPLAHPLTRKAALRLSAEVHERLGDRQAALRDLAAALAAGEDLPWPDELGRQAGQQRVGEAVRLQHVSAMLEQRRFQDAERLLQALVRDYPQSVTSWSLFAWTQLNLEQWTEAERAARQALRIKPASAEAMLYLGTARMFQRDRQDAAAWYRKALDQQPELLQGYVNLGICLKEQGQHEAALEVFRDGLRCHPLSSILHAQLGALLLESNQAGKALEHLQQAVELGADDAATKKMLAEARRQSHLQPK